MDGPQPVDCVPGLDLDLYRIPDIAQTILGVFASIIHLVRPPQPPGGAKNLGVRAVSDVTELTRLYFSDVGILLQKYSEFKGIRQDIKCLCLIKRMIFE